RRKQAPLRCFGDDLDLEGGVIVDGDEALERWRSHAEVGEGDLEGGEGGDDIGQADGLDVPGDPFLDAVQLHDAREPQGLLLALRYGRVVAADGGDGEGGVGVGAG